MKYRKKPVVIEATQWFKNGDHPLDFAKEKQGFESGELRTWTGEEVKANGWEGQIVRYYRTPAGDGKNICQHCGQTMHAHGWIDTLEGGHIVCPGDWIITGIKGEKYPCKPDIFAATYQLADKPTDNTLEELRRDKNKLIDVIHRIRNHASAIGDEPIYQIANDALKGVSTR